jgi:hypothetical protein
LGLLARAAGIFRELGDYGQLGLTRAHEGGLYLEEESPATALAPLLDAQSLVDLGRFPWPAVQVLLHLALCFAELGRGEAAGRSLAAARESRQLLRSERERLLFLWLEARIVQRMGRHDEAASKLLAAARGLAREAPGEAAVAAIELIRLWLDMGRKQQLSRLSSELGPLLQAEALPRRSRSILAFVLRFAAREDAPVPELLERAYLFMLRARRNPQAEFPPRQEPLTAAEWNGLAADFRLDLCRLTGVDDEVAGKPASELDATTREHLSWAAEELLQTAILYGSARPGS